ncbi:MAG: hypothetical protein C0506_04720 [Anaerolinea sp.]|nr:hypothetical protein [Anaerolinea sp.]
MSARSRGDAVNIEFRRADPAECDAAFLALLDEVHEDGEHARRVLASLRHDLFVARDGDRLVGGALCSELLVRGRTGGGVENLAVSPDYHGRGIGRGLMEMAEGHYRRLGFQGMQLTVRADNAPARALYDSLGYQAVERRVRMWKEFAPETPGGHAEANVRVIQRWTDDVWNRGRLEEVAELVAEGCLRHDAGKPARAISVAENLERIASFRKQVPDLHFINNDLVADGDRVVARFTMTGTDPEKHERFVFSGIEIFRLAGGKIVETWSSETATGPWRDSARG